MSAPYSLDLREKVIKNYRTTNITQRKLAENLSISLSTVIRYLHLDSNGLSLAPKKAGKGRPAAISESGSQTIAKIIESDPTITLQELSKQYYKKHKRKVGRSVLSRACQKLKLSIKKLSFTPSERESDIVKKKG